MKNYPTQVFLQKSIEICERIEQGEIKIEAGPYIDFETGYLISMIKFDCKEWCDCTVNNQPDWFAYRPEIASEFTLFLMNRHSKNVYLLTV